MQPDAGRPCSGSTGRSRSGAAVDAGQRHPCTHRTPHGARWSAAAPLACRSQRHTRHRLGNPHHWPLPPRGTQPVLYAARHATRRRTHLAAQNQRPGACRCSPCGSPASSCAKPCFAATAGADCANHTCAKACVDPRILVCRTHPWRTAAGAIATAPPRSPGHLSMACTCGYARPAPPCAAGMGHALRRPFHLPALAGYRHLVPEPAAATRLAGRLPVGG